MKTRVLVQMDTPETMPSHWTPEYLAAYHGQPTLIMAGLYIALNTIFVIFRFMSRYVQQTKWAWDDVLVVMSWILNMAQFSTSIGYHVEYLMLHNDLNGSANIAFYVTTVLYVLGVAPPRLAILLLYLKIFIHQSLRVACYVVGVLICATAVADLFALLFMCTPRAKAWDPSLPGHCINIEQLFIWGSFPNLIFDFVILLMPIPVVWRLQTTLRTKLGILATFMIGSIGIITAIIRWAAYFQDRFVHGDISWYVNPLSIWLMTEQATYLMCACIVTYRPLFRRIADTEAMAALHARLLRSRLYASLSRMGRQQTGNETRSATTTAFRMTQRQRWADEAAMLGAGDSNLSQATARTGSDGGGDSVQEDVSWKDRIYVPRSFDVSASQS